MQLPRPTALSRLLTLAHAPHAMARQVSAQESRGMHDAVPNTAGATRAVKLGVKLGIKPAVKVDL
jgi:hypothetical protein